MWYSFAMEQKFEQTLIKYNFLLVEKNKVMNLTAHKTEQESWMNNVQDSLLFVDVFRELGSVCLLDIGSGGGCPAVPIGIAAPMLKVTMLDSTLKKIDFLNSVVKELDLKNMTALHARAEELAHDGANREKFDCVTARAVAGLPTLLEYALPFLKVGGLLFAFKGKNWNLEIENSKNALKTLGCEIAAVHQKILTNDIERALIVVRKTRETDKKYPRMGNAPRTKPL